MTDANSQDPGSGRARNGVSRRRFLQGAAGGAAFLVGAPLLQRPGAARAAGSNPIVVENARSGTGAFQLGPGTASSNFGGFATKTSVVAGEELRVKLVDFSQSYQGPGITATLEIYRLGYYGGAGGRLVDTVVGAPLRYQDAFPPNDQFGYCGLDDAWPQSSLIPTSGLESGMYLIKVRPDDTSGRENHIPFVVRADDRPRDLLVVMPTNTWQAYNNITFKSLYNSLDLQPGSPTLAGVDSNGRSRAVKVSFDRPYGNVFGDLNWVLRTEFPLIYWLEQQGYDVTYTDDVALDAAGIGQLTAPITKSIAIAGHSEYWTKGMFDNISAARDAGTHIASFSANTAYWQVRYEDQRRTMVCFKTVAGIDSDAADNGKDGVNDFGPLDAAGAGSGATDRGGAFDSLGSDGTAGGGNDRPQYATTTFRDPGALPGSANAPDGAPAARDFEGQGRVGPNRPENSLWGVLFVGGDGKAAYPLQVPAGAGQGGEFGAHPAWRHTTLTNQGGGSIGSNLIGWEWDAIPRGNPGDASHLYARYLGAQPAGVKRLTETDVNALRPQVPPANRDGLIFLLDEGRRFSYSTLSTPATPPAGQGSAVNAVTYRGPSGALVFSAGTMQWSWGLGPHFEALPQYDVPRIDSSEPNIQQATCNILADGGVLPATPVGVILDSGTQPPPETGPPKPIPTAGRAPKLGIRAGQRKVIGEDGEVRLRVSCRKQDRGGCFGKVTLVAELPRLAAGGARRKPRRVKLGSRRVELVPGQSKILTFKLSKKHRRMLSERKRLKVLVEARVSDLAGNGGPTKGVFRLYAKRRYLPGKG